jgi:hypothetical protein
MRWQLSQEEAERRLAEHDRWLRAHPWWSHAIALWFALFVLVLAELLEYVSNSLARMVSP